MQREIRPGRQLWVDVISGSPAGKLFPLSAAVIFVHGACANLEQVLIEALLNMANVFWEQHGTVWLLTSLIPWKRWYFLESWLSTSVGNALRFECLMFMTSFDDKRNFWWMLVLQLCCTIIWAVERVPSRDHQPQHIIPMR